MANNPFTRVSQTKNNVKRNVWDWSHDFHFTTEIGRITPCFCTRLGAGQSLSVKAAHAEQFMPMMFPIQNRIRSRVSFYKIPIRALWKDYMDYISSVNQVDSNGNPIISKYEEPYIGIDSAGELAEKFDKFFGTCSTLDYLGLPTTLDSSVQRITFDWLYRSGVHVYTESEGIPVTSGWIDSGSLDVDERYLLRPFGVLSPSGLTSLKSGTIITCKFNFSPFYTPSEMSSIAENIVGSNDREIQLCKITPVGGANGSYDASPIDFIVDSVSLDQYNFLTISFKLTSDFNNISYPCLGVSVYMVSSVEAHDFSTYWDDVFAIPSAAFYSYSTCPWYNKTTKEGLKLSSYPLRALEAIYNAYFRYDRNNPLSVGGVKKYNDWVLCRDKGGNDSDNYAALQIDGEVSPLEYFYGRKYCNWEPDFLSTAVQSPQDGPAPLVGLTSYVVTSEENGVTTRRLASVLTDEDGQSYNVSFQTDENGLTGATYEKTEADSITGTPITTRYKAVSEGISIEDFRQVNAYQRYLELNMRRGYSYKDIIEGRFDVNVRYDELLMPEFCGGFTRDININPVTQTTPTDESGTYQGSLGSQAGQAFGSGKNKGNIKIYADEDSIVIGLVVIWPDPVYTQILPKHFLYRDPLDLFNPEFANIGFQPIKVSEVAPIQAWNNAKSRMNEVFGYQRPWYEMLSQVNTAHGLYRTQLRNFLMYRRFSGIPQLSKEFLLIHPDQVNDVFSVTETTDKIFGMIRFSIRAKNGVPRNNVPRIE